MSSWFESEGEIGYSEAREGIRKRGKRVGRKPCFKPRYSANRFGNYSTFIAFNDEDLNVKLFENCSISKYHCN